MSNKITKLELHFNFHKRFLRGPDSIKEHLTSYAFNCLHFSDRKMILNRELYNIIFICEEEKEQNYNKSEVYLSKGFKEPLFSQCLTENIKAQLEAYFFYLDFSLLDRFESNPNVSGRIIISRKNDVFIMGCEFVSLDPHPYKRTDINFMFNNNECFKRAIDKICMLNNYL